MLYICGFLAVIFSIAPLVLAEEGYTQGWLGAPDWVLDRTDTSILPDFYIPRNISGTNVEIPTVSSSIAKGNQLIASESFLDAKKQFEEAINLDSNSYDAWLGLGYALEGSKRYQSAIDAYKTASSLCGGEDSAWAAYAGLGRVSLILGQYQAAEQAFQTAIEMIDDTGYSETEDRQALENGLAEARQKLGGGYGAVFSRSTA
ncbi:tetratricopeptide repeat protein [Methanospirillum lacunae]|nr:tetratricopeptide repeat protein [Methanospirillum lacunae]